MKKRPEIRIEVWTGHFLGTRAKAEEFIALLHSLDGGRWIPDKWDHFEPVRRTYETAAREDIVNAFGEVRGNDLSNDVNFTKSLPRASFSVSVWRSRVEFMNRVYVDLDAMAFSSPDGPDRICSILRDLVEWSGAVFASARHTSQGHWRVAQKTPVERIQEMDWLTFFGKPYIEMFGGEKRVLNAPCFKISELHGGLMLIASSRPDSSEMTTSDAPLLQIEEYLGADAFAGRGYPEVPCRVPVFDLSETRNS